jgi:hypothetical protein
VLTCAYIATKASLETNLVALCIFLPAALVVLLRHTLLHLVNDSSDERFALQFLFFSNIHQILDGDKACVAFRRTRLAQTVPACVLNQRESRVTDSDIERHKT